MSATTQLVGWYTRYEEWTGLDRVLRRSPAQSWFRHRAADRLAVLGYHGIDDPKKFADHLDRLLEIACPVSLHEVEDAAQNRVPLPPHSVLLTFDDGHRSIYDDGLHLLAARGVPAVCFVVAGLVDTDRPFWPVEVTHLVRHGGTAPGLDTSSAEACLYDLKLRPEHERHRALALLRSSAGSPAPPEHQLTGAELRELEAAGIAIGNHTLTHPCLQHCDDAQVRTEVLRAHEQLTSLLGHAPTSFAYPNGGFTPVAHHTLIGAGYRSGFLYDHRLAAPGVQHPLRLSRLRVSTFTPSARLETVLSGLQPAVYRAVRAAGRVTLGIRQGNTPAERFRGK